MVRTLVFPAVWAALRSFRNSPVRSLTVLQGIIWSTAFGIVPPAIIEGSRQAAVERAAELGSDRVLVYEAPSEKPRLSWDLTARFRGLGWRDLREVGAFGVSGELLLVDAETPRQADRELVAGRWLSAQELRDGAPLALISESSAAKRFPGVDVASVVGRTVEVTGALRPLRVVGVFRVVAVQSELIDNLGLKKEHALRGAIDEMMRYTGVLQRDDDWIRDASLVVAPARLIAPAPAPRVIRLRIDPDKVTPRIRELRTLLIEEGLRPIIQSNHAVQILFSGPLERIEKMHQVIFVICLVAGVVVVANTVVLSVLERRREIAVRRVEGATTLVVAAQFFVETGAFCLLGALLGVPLALGLAWFRAWIDPSAAVQWTIPVPETLQTVSAVLVFGLLGGILPAIKAARVQPVEVLSSE